jgi:polyisoprenoid-binding protein YceI
VVRRAGIAELTITTQETAVPKKLALLMLAALPLAATAATESFTMDPLHSSVNFSVEHLGLSLIYGRFNKFSGKFAIDRAAKSGSTDVSIETVSVDTNDNDKGSRPRSRDEHLRSADFFNAAEFPRMTYKSTGVTFAGDNPATLEGSLTLLGVTKPVTLTFERFKCNPATATAKERCGGVAVGKIKRSDFGMKRGIPSVGDDIALIISFEGDKD